VSEASKKKVVHEKKIEFNYMRKDKYGELNSVEKAIIIHHGEGQIVCLQEFQCYN
jgi:hypothetical protein